jgi:hypothetical protein
MRALSIALLVLSLGCSESKTEAPTQEAGPRVVVEGKAAWETAGPAPVGHAIFTAKDAARDRSLTIQVWYPADASARDAAQSGTALEDLVIDAKDHATIVGLLASAPDKCARKRGSFRA